MYVRLFYKSNIGLSMFTSPFIFFVSVFQPFFIILIVSCYYIQKQSMPKCFAITLYFSCLILRFQNQNQCDTRLIRDIWNVFFHQKTKLSHTMFAHIYTPLFDLVEDFLSIQTSNIEQYRLPWGTITRYPVYLFIFTFAYGFWSVCLHDCAYGFWSVCLHDCPLMIDLKVSSFYVFCTYPLKNQLRSYWIDGIQI